MAIEKYRIEATPEHEVRDAFEAYMQRIATPGGSWQEFRVNEIIPAVTYAVHYFVDAVQDLLYRHMKDASATPMEIELPSGWRVKSLDLGLHWKRHLEMVHPGDPEQGFILACELDCNRSPDAMEAARSRSRSEIATAIIREIMEAEDVVKNNGVTALYDPANSTRFDEIEVFAYDMSEGGYYSRDHVIGSLVKGQYAPKAFEHRPHRMYDHADLPEDMSMVQVSTVGGGVAPGTAMLALPVIAELLAALDPEDLDAAYAAFEHTAHYTLEEDMVEAFKIVRSCLSKARADGPYPPAPFGQMIEEMWKRAVCIDVVNFLTQINEATNELIALGHTSAAETFDCNDMRTRVYATDDGDVRRTFVDRDENGVCVAIRNDRIVVSTGDYDNGTEDRVLFDFTVEDGAVTGMNTMTPYDQDVASTLRVALVDLSSVHCHLVSDRETEYDAPKMD